MRSKAFGWLILAGIAGVGVAIGCSSSTDSGGGTSDAGPEASSTARPPTDSGGDDTADAGACPLTVAPAKETYTPPTAPSNACTADELTKVDAILTGYGDTLTFSTFKTDVTNAAEVGAGCRSCIFTDRTAATWGPLPLDATNSGSINFAGCYQLYSNSAACGESQLDEDDCISGVCDDCAPSGTAQTKCIKAASSGICKDVITAETTACGAAGTGITTCDNITGVIAIMCSLSADAGPDADGAP